MANFKNRYAIVKSGNRYKVKCFSFAEVERALHVYQCFFNPQMGFTPKPFPNTVSVELFTEKTLPDGTITTTSQKYTKQYCEQTKSLNLIK